MYESSALRWLLPLTALACVGRDETFVARNYDNGTLFEFRSAIPTEERLVAGVPTAAAEGTMAAANPAALLAGQGVVFARGINLTARDVALTLTRIAAGIPSDFDAARQEFLWGPWQNPSGPGELTLRLRRADAGDFEFTYELERQMPQRPDTRLAVVWGGSNPDRDGLDRGSGLTVLDLDANAAFEASYDGEPDGFGQGRFAMAHGYQQRATDGVYFNLTEFSNFVSPADEQVGETDPVSVEHFFGRVAEPSGTVIDFLHSEIDADLCGENPRSCFGALPDWSDAERFVFGEFVINSGSGRAEVELGGGDLASQVQMTECWNDSLTRTSYEVRTNEMAMQMVDSASCPGRAAQSSAELGLPTPADVQPWLQEALTCAMAAGSSCN